jgi:hypothetical protein
MRLVLMPTKDKLTICRPNNCRPICLLRKEKRLLYIGFQYVYRSTSVDICKDTVLLLSLVMPAIYCTDTRMGLISNRPTSTYIRNRLTQCTTYYTVLYSTNMYAHK